MSYNTTTSAVARCACYVLKRKSRGGASGSAEDSPRPDREGEREAEGVATYGLRHDRGSSTRPDGIESHTETRESQPELTRDAL